MIRRLALAALAALALTAIPATTGAATPTRVTITQPGTYHLTDSHGRPETVTLTEGPVTRQATAATTTTASYWCRSSSYLVVDGGSVDLFLFSDFCWNGSSAVAYDTHGSCTSIAPGGECFYHETGDYCSYCGTAEAWGKFYSATLWAIPMNSELAIWTNKYGSVWASTWGI